MSCVFGLLKLLGISFHILQMWIRPLLRRDLSSKGVLETWWEASAHWKKKCHFYSQILWTGLNGHFTLDPGHQCYILFFWHKVFFLIFVQCWASSNVCKKINKKTWCSSQRLCCFHRFQPATCVSFHSPVSSSWLPREPVESRVKDVLSLMLVRFVIIWHSSALTCTEPRSEILWCKFEHADCMKEKGTWVLFFFKCIYGASSVGNSRRMQFTYNIVFEI